MKHDNLFVWMQTSTKRDSSRTVASLEASDIGNVFTTITDVVDREFPEGYPELQKWWECQMIDMATKAKSCGCQWMLRLEDDIVVNRHIVYNISKWPALNDPYFGVGLLFYPNYWHKTPWAFERSPDSYEIFKKGEDIEGAQGQVLRVDMVPKLIELSRRAIQDKGIFDSVSFDWSITRAASYLGRETHPGISYRAFTHKPALVDIHNESLKSIIGNTNSDPRSHYWGDEEFSPTWRR